MPSHASNTPITSHHLNLDQTSVACPAPLTPPPESTSDHEIVEGLSQQRPADVGEDEVSRRPVSDNTAAGMSLMQEDSMYTGSAFFEEKMHSEESDGTMEVDRPTVDIHTDETTKMTGDTCKENYRNSPDDDGAVDGSDPTLIPAERIVEDTKAVIDSSGSAPLSPPPESSQRDQTRAPRDATDKAGVPTIDQELDWSSDLREWDFSRRRLLPQYPSATFQPYSKFKGTQQSDRQIYNVEVTILTVDIEQSTMSGYLQICGLTPDHPTLTTFFTGEIIGGPNQKYSFRTRDPAWGASDKTDLTHWARFPAWRPLSLQAKRNINFVYPLNHEHWWQQECIFMRWKEHFLVPDYKLKSIQGASFEGFYYICFNQVEGRVSGIYFHSKSEK
ncbi:vacuolar import and degradation protein-domain-containing protein [Exophiala viscosa]|uniref:Vacuolar import and degradation protein-domain-containing protein n=1 Tax=Exophiala viscosa TaxID=2486360 RepID=A0AAN6IFG8_9EURO|nr:vacuolar import and degradation protein-domain-containing protein [Exophiala viscosa]